MPSEDERAENEHNDDLVKADHGIDQQEKDANRKHLDNEPGTDELEDDQSRDRVVEYVVSKLKEVSAVRMDDYAFCDIVAVLGNHNQSLYKESNESEYLRVALYLAIAAVVAMPREHVKLFMVVGVLTDVLKSKFELYGNMKDIVKAIELSEEAVLQASPVDADRADFLCALSFLYESKYKQTFGVEDLEWAVYHGEDAVAAVSRDHENYAIHQHNLGDKLSTLYNRTGLKDHLDRAKDAALQAVDATPLGHPNRAAYLNNLANCGSKKAKLSGRQGDAQEALRLAQEVVDTASPDEWRYPIFLTNLGNRNSDMYEIAGNIDYINESIKFGRLTLEQNISNDTIFHRTPSHMSNLAASLALRYKKTHSQDDLRQAIDLEKAALELLPLSPRPERASIAGNLSTFLEFQYEDSRDIGSLEEAIYFARCAVAESLSDSPDEGDHLEMFSRLLARQFKCTNDPKDLEEAEKAAKLAVIAPVHEGADDISRWVAHSNLANTIASTFSLERTLTTDGVDRAYSMAQMAISHFPNSDRRRPLLLNNLASVIQFRFKRSNSQQDLDTAIALVEEGLASIDPKDGDRALLLSNLSHYLSLKYDYTRYRSQLEDHVFLAEEALEVAKAENLRDMTRYYSGLASALCRRYRKHGNSKDIERAASLSEEAIAATPPGRKGKLARMQNNASVMRSVKAEAEIGSLADMERAIELAENAVESTPEGHHHLPKYRRSLADHYLLSFKMKGTISDLDHAIELLEDTISSLPQGHLHRSSSLEALSSLYQWKFGITHRTKESHDSPYSEKNATDPVEYLDKAIEISFSAVNSCDKDDWDRARLLEQLGDRILRKASISQSDDDIETCLWAYDTALKADMSAPRDRISAARSAASVCMQAGAAAKATEFLAEAMSILPRIHTRSSERQDEYDQAADFHNLASDAAAIALQAGKTAYEALGLLESGNAVIIGSAIDCRSDLSDLYSTHPEIAEEFDETRHEIDASISSSTKQELSHIFIRDRYGPVAKKRRAAAEHLEALLLRIRALPGHEKFLLPPSEGQLLQLAAFGPVVVLNSSFMAKRADAIVITTESIRSIYLDEATKREFYKPSREAIDAGPEAEEFALETDVLKGGLRTRAKRNVTMGHVLEYAWKTFIKPVCAFLGDETKHSSDRLPHVTWIRFGLPFNQIPIHAVSDPSEGPRANVYSRMISSYAPSIKALIYARERDFTFLDLPNPRLLVATMETTPGTFSRLPSVKDEIHAIKTVTEDQGRTTQTTFLPQPSAELVLSELSKSQAVHFACHGSSDTSDPSNNSLIFTRRPSDLRNDNGGKEEVPDPLRVRDISLSNHSGPTDMQLAYLSACSGASVDIQALADETIHMASGFLLAGFSHVIATLWNVGDDVCVEVARGFYGELLLGLAEKEGRVQRHQRVAWALHRALEPVRKEYIDEPLVWGGFIHLGA